VQEQRTYGYYVPAAAVTGVEDRFRALSGICPFLDRALVCHSIGMSDRFSRQIMNRRDFLRANTTLSAGWALARAMPALADMPSAGGWRTFEVVTKVELLKPNGISRIWLPAPLIRNTPYQNTISTRFTAKGGTATLSKGEQSALGIVSAMYAANEMPTLNLASH
jgi:hypothetical protein